MEETWDEFLRTKCAVHGNTNVTVTRVRDLVNLLKSHAIDQEATNHQLQDDLENLTAVVDQNSLQNSDEHIDLTNRVATFEERLDDLKDIINKSSDLQSIESFVKELSDQAAILQTRINGLNSELNTLYVEHHLNITPDTSSSTTQRNESINDSAPHDSAALSLSETIANWRDVPKFAGISGMPFSEWIDKLEDMFLIHDNNDESSKKAHLRFCLQGAARACYDANNTKTYAEICEALKTRFSNRISKNQARSSLQSLKQGLNESVGSYIDRCCETIRRADLPPAVISHFMLHEFISGLKPKIRTQVKIDHPTDTEKAIELALKYEAIYAEPYENTQINKQRPVCSFCRKPGHVDTKCWHKNPKLRRTQVTAFALDFKPTGLLTYQFTGTQNIPFGEWLKDLEALFAMSPNRLTEDRKLAILRAHLQGLARHEFNTQKPIIDTAQAADLTQVYSEMVKYLTNKFPASHAKARALSRLDAVTFDTNKGVLHFAELIRANATRGIENQEARDFRMLHDFVKGLPAKLRARVRAKEPTDFDAAVNFAADQWLILKEEAESEHTFDKSQPLPRLQMNVFENKLTQIEKLLTNLSSRPKQNSANFTPIRRVRFTDQINKEKPKFIQNLPQNNQPRAIQPVNDNKRIQNLTRTNQANQPQRQCFKCNNFGHFARDCPQNIVTLPLQKLNQNTSLTNQVEEAQKKLNAVIAEKAEQNNKQAHVALVETSELETPKLTPEQNAQVKQATINLWNNRPGLSLSRNPTNSLKLGTFALLSICLMMIFTLITPTMAFLHQPVLCHPEIRPQIWKIPKYSYCSNWKHTHELRNVNVTDMKIRIYSARPITFYDEADHCKIVKTTTTYYSNILNDHFIQHKHETMPTSLKECRKMIYDKKCSHGILDYENGLWLTNNTVKPNFKWSIFGLKPTIETVFNCYLDKTKIFINRHSEDIQTAAGFADNCKFTASHCDLSDQSHLVWHVSQANLCRLTERGHFEGLIRAKHWVAKSAELALSFKSSNTFSECEKRFYETDQGFAVEQNEALQLHLDKVFDKNPKRVKRSNQTEKIPDALGIATVKTNQLASQLSHLKSTILKEITYIYNHLLSALCELSGQFENAMPIMASINPTAIARELLKTPYCQAKFLAPRTLIVWQCAVIDPQTVKIRPTNDNTTCFKFLPITLDYHGKTFQGFYDPLTQILSRKSKKGNCKNHRRIFAMYINQHSWIDQVTGQIHMQDIPTIPKHYTPFEEQNENREIFKQMYRNLILGNLTEEDPIMHMNAENAQQEFYDDIIDVFPTLLENATTQLNKAVSKGFFGFITGIHFDLWQIWIFSVCTFVTFKTLSPFAILAAEIILRYYGRYITSLRRRFSRHKPQRKAGIVQWSLRNYPEIELSASVTSENDPSLTVKALIEDKPATLIIDTGSHLSLITETFLESLKDVEIWDSDMRIFDVACKAATTTKAAKIRCKIGEREESIQVHAVKCKNFGNTDAQIIIGRYDLTQFGKITFDFDLQRIQIDSEWVKAYKRPSKTRKTLRCTGKLFRNLKEYFLEKKWNTSRAASLALNTNPVNSTNASVLAIINDEPVAALLDSGSVLTIAPIKVAEILKIKHIDQCEVDVLGISGRQFKIIGCAPAKVTLGNETVNTTIYLADLPLFKNYEVILGIDTMRKFSQITFDLAKCVVTVGQTPLLLGDPYSAFPTRTPIRVLATSILQPNSEQLVKAVIGPLPHVGTFHYTNGPLEKRLVEKNIAITPGVYTPDYNGTIQVCLQNPTQEYITIFEDTNLATAFAVTKIDDFVYQLIDDLPTCNATDELPADNSFDLNRNDEIIDESYKVNLENAQISEDQTRQLQALIDKLS